MKAMLNQKSLPMGRDSSYALEVAEQLNIPFHVVDLSKVIKQESLIICLENILTEQLQIRHLM